MIRPLLIVFALATLCAAQDRRVPIRRPAAPVVVELFTSEGCSSCPPADNVLIQLERRGDVIVMSEHVDYWDHLGWRDPFSSPLFSTRQQDYGVALRAGNVFTPQAVINGEVQVLGSDMRAITRAANEAARKPQAAVNVRLTNRQTVLLQVSKLPPGSGKVDVLLAVTESGLESNVSAGENSGRKLRHAAVVRSLTRVAELDEARPGEYIAEARLNLRPEWVRANTRLVLITQSRESRKIVGVNTLRL